MTNHIKYFLIFLFANCITFFDIQFQKLFITFTLFFFFNWVVLIWESFYIYWIPILSQTCVLQIFFPSLWLVFPFLTLYFKVQLLILRKSNLLIFNFIECTLCVPYKKFRHYSGSERFSPMFS